MERKTGLSSVDPKALLATCGWLSAHGLWTADVFCCFGVLMLAQQPAWELSGHSAQTPLSGPFFTDAVSYIPRLPHAHNPSTWEAKAEGLP